jgi:C_GCAxxG_C_C family probable redox protein
MEDARALARWLFLDPGHTYGCAETALLVLKAAYGLEDPTDASPAMALNGGVAYAGEVCGAVTGAAIAVGMLAERRTGDHATAKPVARRLMADAIQAFREANGTLVCRELTGFDLTTPEGHQAFLDSGVWRDRCMAHIEGMVSRLAPLADPGAWEQATADLASPPAAGPFR